MNNNDKQLESLFNSDTLDELNKIDVAQTLEEFNAALATLETRLSGYTWDELNAYLATRLCERDKSTRHLLSYIVKTLYNRQSVS